MKDNLNFLSEFIDNQKVSENKNVALIDGDIVLFSVCSDKKQTQDEMILFGIQSERTLEQVKEELDRYLFNIITESGCMYYIGFLSKGSFRYEIATLKPYKGNRVGRELPRFYKECRDYLIDKWKFIQEPGYEADDLLGIYQNKIVGYDTIVLSVDKDLKQIEGRHYNFRTKEFSEVNKEQGDYKLYKQMLTGDTVDNIKFLGGVGDKTADKILSKSLDGNHLYTVLDEYITVFGLRQGINYFTECFNLIYILKDDKSINIQNPYNIEDIMKDGKDSGVDLWGE